MIATALAKPETLGLLVTAYTLDRVTTCLPEARDIATQRSRIDEILPQESLRWRKHETWVPSKIQRVYATMDNLSPHRTTDMVLFLMVNSRRELVFQPKDAASLNLIELWWKILRSR